MLAARYLFFEAADVATAARRGDGTHGLRTSEVHVALRERAPWRHAGGHEPRHGWAGSRCGARGVRQRGDGYLRHQAVGLVGDMSACSHPKPTDFKTSPPDLFKSHVF